MRRILSMSAFSMVLLPGAMALAGTTHQARGEITALDSAARTLVVKAAQAPRQEIHLTLMPDARIIASGKPGTVGDLKTGEQVKVTYADEGAVHQASRVEIVPARAGKS